MNSKIHCRQFKVCGQIQLPTATENRMLAGSTVNNGMRSYESTNIEVVRIFPGIVNIYINRITRKDMAIGLVNGIRKRGERVVFG